MAQQFSHKLRKSDCSIYFTGGSQERITTALIEKDGSDCCRAMHGGGCRVERARPSASTTMIREIPDILGRDAGESKHLDRGLASGPGVHDRPALHRRPHRTRSMAAGYVGRAWRKTRPFARGARWWWGPGCHRRLVDASIKVTSTVRLRLTGAVVHLPDRGDHFDVTARKVIPAATRAVNRPIRQGLQPLLSR